jgi:Prophage CP4-57 regulatory protein (AlpA).
MLLPMMTAVDELVGAAEIGRMFGVGRARVYQLTSRADFPAPAHEFAMGKVWRTAEVRAWAEARGRTVLDDSTEEDR